MGARFRAAHSSCLLFRSWTTRQYFKSARISKRSPSTKPTGKKAWSTSSAGNNLLIHGEAYALVMHIGSRGSSDLFDGHSSNGTGTGRFPRHSMGSRYRAVPWRHDSLAQRRRHYLLPARWRHTETEPGGRAQGSVPVL